MINKRNTYFIIYQRITMDHTTPQSNPLSQYFRSVKLYTKIPSNGKFYQPGVVDLTESLEVGVLPMTGKDELILKNPDALLNGEALIEVIKSCAPAVKDPRKLLTNDLDALITAIRYATYQDSLEAGVKCPNCEHENTFKLDLQYALDNMTELENEYVVNLSSGLSVFVKPYSFPDLMKGLHAEFEQAKITKAVRNDLMSEEERSKVFSNAFKELAVTKFALMCSGIIRIVDEAKGIDVTDKGFISEFLQNTDNKSIDLISDLINEINEVGIKRTFVATCEKCNHTWDTDFDFNPVNFS